MLTIILAVLALLPADLTAQDAVSRDANQMHRLHKDPQAYIGALEDPQRDAYQKPQEVLTALNLRPAKSLRISARVRAISHSVLRIISAQKEKCTPWM